MNILFKIRHSGRSFPASLTKMMTLYIVFEHLKDGTLQLTDKISMSTKACRMPSSKARHSAFRKEGYDSLSCKISQWCGHGLSRKGRRLWVWICGYDELGMEDTISKLVRSAAGIIERMACCCLAVSSSIRKKASLSSSGSRLAKAFIPSIAPFLGDDGLRALRAHQI